MMAMLVVLAVAVILAWVGPNERELWRLRRWLNDVEAEHE